VKEREREREREREHKHSLVAACAQNPRCFAFTPKKMSIALQQRCPWEHV